MSNSTFHGQLLDEHQHAGTFANVKYKRILMTARGDLGLRDSLKSDFFDVINYSICKAVDEFLDGKAIEFFRKVGEEHFDEALKRGFVKITDKDKPLDVLIKIARYLESVGNMEKIQIGENEAIVEMHGVSVTRSSVELLKANKQPSHYMTNIMLAALMKLGVRAELEDVKFDEEKRYFKEHWKVL